MFISKTGTTVEQEPCGIYLCSVCHNSGFINFSDQSSSCQLFFQEEFEAMIDIARKDGLLEKRELSNAMKVLANICSAEDNPSLCHNCIHIYNTRSFPVMVT